MIIKNKNSKNSHLFPTALNAHNLKTIFLLLLPGIIILQIPSFVRYAQCLDSQQKVCDASMGTIQIFLALTFPLFILLGIKLKKGIHWKDFGLGDSRVSWKKVLALMVMGVGLIIVLNLIISLLARHIPILGQEQFVFKGDVTFVSILPFAVFAIIVAPLVEEITFRGFEFSIIGRRFGVLAGAIITSVSFGIVHGQVAAGIVTAIFGLYLCYMFYKTGSLWPGIALHALNNTIGVVLLLVTK